MKIHFKDVGRDNKSWTKEFKNGATENDIAREAKRGGGLCSNSYGAEIHENGSTGEVWVGLGRTVGTFTIES